MISTVEGHLTDVAVVLLSCDCCCFVEPFAKVTLEGNEGPCRLWQSHGQDQQRAQAAEKDPSMSTAASAGMTCRTI
ncbi:MAG: hypothetical protein LKE40_13690 [Spirochaetia bacterium]|jgi:hypothetical protein|nr:hypothetical protein [Spirochaetia bacterium]